MQALRDKFINFILSRPKAALIVSFFIFIVSMMGIPQITSDFTPRIWFPDEHPILRSLDEFEKRFGTDQVIALGLYHKDGLLNKERLEDIKEITDKMWTINSVYRVDSLSNFNHIQSSENDIEITPLFEVIDPKEIMKKIDLNPDLNNNLISTDKEVIFIRAQIKPLFGKSPVYEEIMNDLEEVLRPYEAKGIKFIRVGSIPITYAFKMISLTDNLKIVPFMFGFIFLLLIYYYRSIIGIFAPLIVSFITILTVFGALGLIGIVFNSILAAIPGILLAICLADTIHILTSYYHKRNEGKDVRDALVYSLNKNFLATVLTTITTTISFVTISFTDLIPLSDLGILAAIGCILAWLNTYLILPPLILLAPEKWSKPKKYQEDHTNSNPLIKLSHFILNRKMSIVIIFSIISITSIYLSTQNEVNSDPVKYFRDSTSIKQAYYKAKKHYKGLRAIEIEIDSGKAEGVKDPKFLNKVESFFDKLYQKPDVIKISSVITILKKMNKYLLSGEDKDLQIPNDKEKVAEALMLYSFGLPQGLGLDNLLSLDNRYLKFRLRWTLETTKEAVTTHEEIYKIAQEMGLKIRTGGYFPIYARVNSLVVESFLKSMSMAVVFVSIIILIVFRNWKLALLAMLPNVIPLTMGAAFMSIFDIYIDIGTSIVSAICLGIAVDDTIHFITHFEINRKKYKSTKKALDETFLSTGKALILTTVLLVVGFGSFIMAEFLPNHYFGILCAIVLSFALLTDLLFLPALLLIREKNTEAE